jgi:hypothetical protein
LARDKKIEIIFKTYKIFKVLLMPGCPPFATAQQATQIREALGLEITEKEKEAFKHVPT